MITTLSSSLAAAIARASDILHRFPVEHVSPAPMWGSRTDRMALRSPGRKMLRKAGGDAVSAIIRNSSPNRVRVEVQS